MLRAFLLAALALGCVCLGSAYHVHHVARMLTKDSFDLAVQKVIDSQNHQTLFVRFFMRGEGDRTHYAWEHVARSPHKIHGANFADVDCADQQELKVAHSAGHAGWPMIKYFNYHTGPEGVEYHPPSHVTTAMMRRFIIDVVVDAHTESRRKHEEHLDAKHAEHMKQFYTAPAEEL